MEITKKLVSEITKSKLIFTGITIKNNNINFRYRYKCASVLTNATANINLNDFLLDCKKWAFEKGFLITEEYDKVKVFNKVVNKEILVILNKFNESDEEFTPYDRTLLIDAYEKILELIKQGVNNDL
jgi:hypothetical protein